MASTSSMGPDIRTTKSDFVSSDTPYRLRASVIYNEIEVRNFAIILRARTLYSHCLSGSASRESRNVRFSSVMFLASAQVLRDRWRFGDEVGCISTFSCVRGRVPINIESHVELTSRASINAKLTASRSRSPSGPDIVAALIKRALSSCAFFKSLYRATYTLDASVGN